MVLDNPDDDIGRRKIELLDSKGAILKSKKGFLSRIPEAASKIKITVLLSVIFPFLTLVVIYFQFRLDRKAIDIQSLQISYALRPQIIHECGEYVVNDTDDPSIRPLLLTTNIGSDTAWAVFTNVWTYVFCDSILARFRYCQGDCVMSSQIMPGKFGYGRELDPGETKKYQVEVPPQLEAFAAALGGIILFRAKTICYDGSPVNRYEEESWFLPNTYSESGKFEKLDEDSQEMANIQIFLKSKREGIIDVGKMIGGYVVFLDAIGDKALHIQYNPVFVNPTYSYPHWTFKDTIFFVNNRVMSSKDIWSKITDSINRLKGAAK